MPEYLEAYIPAVQQHLCALGNFQRSVEILVISLGREISVQVFSPSDSQVKICTKDDCKDKVPKLLHMCCNFIIYLNYKQG